MRACGHLHLDRARQLTAAERRGVDVNEKLPTVSVILRLFQVNSVDLSHLGFIIVIYWSSVGKEVFLIQIQALIQQGEKNHYKCTHNLIIDNNALFSQTLMYIYMKSNMQSNYTCQIDEVE